MTPVWIVMGTAGEYSDRDEWPVAVYLNEAAAQDHVVRAGRRAKELAAWRDADGENHFVSNTPNKPVNEHDPGWVEHSYEVTYYVEETVLIDGGEEAWRAYWASLALRSTA